MSEMVERVAKAISNAEAAEGDWWEHIAEPLRDEYRAMAKAAIQAMREPTEDMIEGYFDAAYADCYEISDVPDYRAGYRAMIDEALK